MKYRLTELDYAFVSHKRDLINYVAMNEGIEEEELDIKKNSS